MRLAVLAVALSAFGCVRACGSERTQGAPSAIDAAEALRATDVVTPSAFDRTPVRGEELDARPPAWPPETAIDAAIGEPPVEEPPVFREEPPDEEREEPLDVPEVEEEDEVVEEVESGPFHDGGDPLTDPDAH